VGIAKCAVQAIQYLQEDRSPAIHRSARNTHPSIQQVHVPPLRGAVNVMAPLPAFCLPGCPESIVDGIIFGGKEGGSEALPEGFR